MTCELLSSKFLFPFWFCEWKFWALCIWNYLVYTGTAFPFSNFTEIFQKLLWFKFTSCIVWQKIVKTHPCELEELGKMEVWRKLNVSQLIIFLHSTAQSSILDTVIELRYVKCLYPVRTRSKHPVYIDYFFHLFI